MVAAADAVIATCGDDLRSAIRALVLTNEFFEYRNRQLAAAFISVRGQFPTDLEFEDPPKDDPC